MSLLRFTKHFYGKLHLGMPFGINLRTVAEKADIFLSQLFSIFTTFTYHHQKLRYFYHSYNRAYDNERIIEIPIFRTFIKHVAPHQLLEIGNVLSHYQTATHTIVDKYEVAPKVINQDVVSFQPKKRYQIIISISTLEHVGQDEVTQDAAKAIKAITHLQSLLKPNGKCIISVPVGHNHQLDKYLYQYSLKNPQQVDYFERVTEQNRWQSITPAKAMKHKYGRPFPCANALAIATFLPASQS